MPHEMDQIDGCLNIPNFRILSPKNRLFMFPKFRVFCGKFLFLLLILIPQLSLGDDTERIRKYFSESSEPGSTINIPPGDYFLAGKEPIELQSNRIIYAYGARFHFPEALEDKSRRVMFSGENISNLIWFGGHFQGRVFDPDATQERWPPNANTRAILIKTSKDNGTQNLTFRDITSDGLAGAAITVLGLERPQNERVIDFYAQNILIDHCSLLRTGKFMWDYGYLWQIAVWPEDYPETKQKLVEKYFRNDLVKTKLIMLAGDDRVQFNNIPPLPLSIVRHPTETERGYDSLCFFGSDLPANIIRGKQYFVIESTPTYIRISDKVQGKPIQFVSSAGPEAKLITNLFQAHLALYAPIGSGPGKGAIDLVGCQGVTVTNSVLSALGDTMHIQKSRDIVFQGNRISGSRMGAFFLAEYCQNATIHGNTVDGTNGSRVMSIEKSCQDVIVTGNTFRNGGRGSWINQPRNFLLSNNIFINNTTKCEPNPMRGRKSFLTGDYENYSEIYFTTYEPKGTYHNVKIVDNIFVSGDHATHMIHFASGGSNLVVQKNTFDGPVRGVSFAEDAQAVFIQNNQGMDISEAGSYPIPKAKSITQEKIP
jgi:hypothetical protein